MGWQNPFKNFGQKKHGVSVERSASAEEPELLLTSLIADIVREPKEKSVSLLLGAAEHIATAYDVAVLPEPLPKGVTLDTADPQRLAVLSEIDRKEMNINKATLTDMELLQQWFNQIAIAARQYRSAHDSKIFILEELRRFKNVHTRSLPTIGGVIHERYKTRKKP